MYNRGTIKIAWIDDDYTIMKSKMFNSVKKAEAFADKHDIDDYMIMELVKRSGHHYQWKVLPYGNWPKYNRYMKLKNVWSSYDEEHNYIIEKRKNERIIIIALVFVALWVFGILGAKKLV